MTGVLSYLADGHTYIEKLLNGGGGETIAMNVGQWLLAVPLTLIYGTFVVLRLLFTLATQDIVGGLSVAALAAFVGLGLWGNRSRAIALLVLAWFNVLLGLPITISVAEDPVLAWTLLANLPALAFVVWTTRQMVRQMRPAFSDSHAAP